MDMIPNKVLIIIRGVSGSSKTTFAKFLLSKSIGTKDWSEADFYMLDDKGNYSFDCKKLGYAHKSCQRDIREAMERDVELIIISNTNSTEKEVAPYLEMAKDHKYSVFSLIMENRNETKSIHNVPIEALERQENNIKGSLKLR